MPTLTFARDPCHEIPGIPIVNNGTEEWQLSARVTGSKTFSGPNSLKVVPGDEYATYEITFKPAAVGEEIHEASPSAV